jgi:tyrosinase
MAYTRRNVWQLGSDWADPILWYARGVKAMKDKPDDLSDRNGWRFYAAIHGFDQGIWQQLEYWTPVDKMPSDEDRELFWLQCQHGTWYFLPWHRGYLLAFEAVIRAEVAELPNGPKDWTLPYWNYFNDGQNKLPPAFASADWPDGKGDNPLFVQQRYGPGNDGKVFVPMDLIDLDAMGDSNFTGSASGGHVGFGGPATGFMHPGGQNRFGGIEAQPHNMVHGLIGGPQAPPLGLMSDPDTAGLDPIFWLHHANIDRLWEIWRQSLLSHVEPKDPKWIKGPASVGQHKFSMPMPGGDPWDYSPADMTDLGKLGYTYDDLASTAVAEAVGSRLIRLGASPEIVQAMKGGAPVTSGQRVELVGANQGSMPIVGTEAQTSVQLDKDVRGKVDASLSAAVEGISPVPDRIFLNLENIRGNAGSPVFRVYVKAPGGQEALAGSVSLFGLRKATLTDREHAGQGLTFVLDITKIIDELHIKNLLDVDALQVKIVPITPVPEEAKVKIGRVSIYREGR